MIDGFVHGAPQVHDCPISLARHHDGRQCFIMAARVPRRPSVRLVVWNAKASYRIVGSGHPFRNAAVIGPGRSHATSIL
jgi:hypothetical protein